jgi:hypothetical protein
MSDFEQRPDSGRLMATQSKKHDKAPDYWGEIAIDLKNLTKIEVVNGLHIVKLSGWKKKSKTGVVYLSLAVDRFIPKTAGEPQRAKEDSFGDDDVPF